MEDEYLTASEIFEMYPMLKRLRMKPQDIGFMVRVGFLDGYTNSKIRQTVANRYELPVVVEMLNRMIKSRTVDLNDKNRNNEKTMQSVLFGELQGTTQCHGCTCAKCKGAGL